MKNNFDKSFKESLEGHEFPYDPKAWDALSKALDQKVPSGNQGSGMKWFIGGAAIVGAIIVSTLYITTTETAEKENTLLSNEVSPTTKTTASDSETDVKSTVNPTNSEKTATEGATQNVKTNDHGSQPHVDPFVFKAGSNDHTAGTGSSTAGTNHTPNRTPDLSTSASPGESTVASVNLPEITSKCQGETFTLDNKNEVNLILVSPSGDESILRSKAKNSVTLNESGVYSIVYMKNNQINKQNSFNVLPAPAVDLSYDPVNIYDKGLPSIQMKSNSIGSSFEWKIQGVQKPSFGKEVNAHFFNRGTYKVNLTVTSSNGCSASESMNITMPEDYNLMAVNAINPNSHIEKNRAFMPHALKERNTPFTLLIIDPASGAIIFESNDVNNPWMGIDKRNGQAVEPNRPYVWKVSLQHPLEGEKAEYKGTVILQ
jgi:hypothetical protein